MAEKAPENLREPDQLRVTLLGDEWGSSKGGLSTLNRELAKALAAVPGVEVSMLVPQCSEQEKQIAHAHHINLVMAQEFTGISEIMRLSFPPEDLAIDVVIGHGQKVGPPAQVIAKNRKCTWVHVVHTASEELAMFKQDDKAYSKVKKKQEIEVDLCKMADLVVAIGPKLAEAWKAYLRPFKKELFKFTPGIFQEFENVEQVEDDLENFRVLVFGRGDPEDFKLKGYDIAAHAIAKLTDKTYRLIFVGAYDEEVNGVINDLLEHGIDRSQLLVRGFRNDREKLSELFNEADLAIMPSRTEGFGLAALEALSAGLPVLVSSNSGFGKALEKLPFGNSYIVTTDDAIDWAKSIKQMRQKNRSARLAEAKNVRTNYAQQYDWFKQCEELVERLRDLRRSGGPSEDTEEKALPYQTTIGKKAFDIPYAMDPEESFEQPVLKTPKGSFSATVPGRTLILQDELKDEGASWELTVAAAHVTFPPQAVTEPQLITCSLWNPRMLSPPLSQQEALVSNVIELSLDGVSSPESSPCFMKEVTLCLSHSASKLEGYEIVIKQLIDKENNQWQDLETANTWHKASAGSSETVLPFAEVRVTHCSTFAAIWRLKSFMFSEKVTSVTLGNSFNVPDYPNISVTFPYGAISPTEEDISMEIKVQEVPHDGMRENGVLPGPILRLSCSHNTEFSKPLTITIPVSLREDVEDIPELMSSQLRIFYQNSDLASSEWEEITAQMDSPPEMNNGVVTFQVRHFSVFWVWFDWRSYSLSRVFLYVSNTYKRSMPQEAAFTACLCETSPCPPFQLALCCYPVHVREQVKREMLTSYAVVRHGEGNSFQPMCKGDNANIRLGEALKPVSGCEIESFFVRFLGDERFLRSDLVHVAEDNVPQVQFSTPQYAGQQSKLLCRLFINPLPHAELTFPSRQALDQCDERPVFPMEGCSRDQPALALPGEVLEALNSKTNEPRDIVVQLQENLQLDQAALKHPDPKTKQMVRSLAVKAKSANRADVVEYLRTITPVGTTGPLLPEDQDVRDIPIKLRKDLTVNMCGGGEWKVLAEKLLLTPAEIRYLDNRTLNPCDAALAHVANKFRISVGNLYDVLVNCEMPQYADIL